MQTWDGACRFNHTSLGLCSTLCCCHLRQTGAGLPAPRAARAACCLGAAFVGTGTGDRAAHVPPCQSCLLSAPVLWEPLRCQCHPVACTVKGKVRDGLTRTARETRRWGCNVGAFLLQCGVSHGSHFFLTFQTLPLILFSLNPRIILFYSLLFILAIL